MKLLSFIILGLIVSSSVFGQDEDVVPVQAESNSAVSVQDETRVKKHSLLISPGVAFTDSKDSAVSQLYRFGIGGKLRIGYEFLDSKQYHLVHLSGGGGLLYFDFPKNLDVPANELQFFLNLLYSSQFAVLQSSPFFLYVGGVIETNIDFWIPEYLNYGWSGHVAAGPAITGLFEQGRHKIKGSFFLPMIGSQTRPMYNSYGYNTEAQLEEHGFIGGGIRILANNSSFAFWHNFFRASFLFDYSFMLASFVDLNVAYSIEGEYRDLPDPTQSKLLVQNSLFLGLVWRW